MYELIGVQAELDQYFKHVLYKIPPLDLISEWTTQCVFV